MREINVSYLFFFPSNVAGNTIFFLLSIIKANLFLRESDKISFFLCYIKLFTSYSTIFCVTLIRIAESNETHHADKNYLKKCFINLGNFILKEYIADYLNLRLSCNTLSRLST